MQVARFTESRALRRVTLVCALLFTIALTIKLLHLEERRRLPDFDRPVMDSMIHDDWAWGLASGQWEPRIESVRTEPYFRAPLYPYFLSSVYRLLGRNHYAARVVQMILGALGVVLMYLLTKRLFGNVAGVSAAVLYMLYWPATYFDGELLIPVLVVLLDLALFLLILRGQSSASLWTWCAAGAVLGLSAIGRPNVLVTVPFLAVWIWRSPRRPRAAVLGFLLVAMAVVAPVTIRNAVVGSDFVPVAWQGGINFYIGNNPGSNGVTAVAPGMHADWWGGYEDTRALAEREAGRVLKPSEISRHWYAKGMSFIASEPRLALKLYLRKIALFLGNGETSNNRQIYFMRDQSRVLSMLPVNFAIILSLSVLGILLVRRSSRKDPEVSRCRSLPLYFAIPYAASVLLFFVTSRYRVPVSVALMPYAGWAVYRCASAVGKRHWRSLGGYGAVVLPLFIASSLNPFDVGGMAKARGLYELGVDYADTEPQKALEALGQSIQLEPAFAPAWKVRGRVQRILGETERAIADTEQATRLDSTFTDAFFQLGYLLQENGEFERAVRPYERVVAMDSTHAPAMINLADIYLREHRNERAGRLLRRALAIDPESEAATFGLAQYFERVGNRDRAVELYRSLAHYPAARLKLVIAYLARGRPDEAERAVEEFEARFGPSQELEGLRRLIGHYSRPRAEP